MYTNHGLSDVYEHYIGKDGNKYYTDYNMVYGSMIRQIKTIDGLLYDSSDGESFQSKMFELGFKHNQYGLFSEYANDNRMLLDFRVNGSNSGIPNKPIALR